MVVYRVIGRRPSAVYVDEQGQPTTDASGTRHRLWDLVFDEYVAEPGDQIQDRHSQITLVAGDGECSRVQLTTPTPRTLDNAFSHASRTLTADWAALDRLVAEGRLEKGTLRNRLRGPVREQPQAIFEDGHPLIVAAGAAGPPPPPV